MLQRLSEFLKENGSNEPKVQRYEAELRHAYNDVSRFTTILKRIAADRSFGKDEALELARVFGIPASRLKNRKSALDEIEMRLFTDHRSRQKIHDIGVMAGKK